MVSICRVNYNSTPKWQTIIDIQAKLAAGKGEVNVLKNHIINYSKTKDVYVGYRKSGYSKKYFDEHESDM